jgi:hypothetical protein
MKQNLNIRQNYKKQSSINNMSTILSKAKNAINRLQLYGFC